MNFGVFLSQFNDSLVLDVVCDLIPNITSVFYAKQCSGILLVGWVRLLLTSELNVTRLQGNCYGFSFLPLQ